jgi:hypothetical protein
MFDVWYKDHHPERTSTIMRTMKMHETEMALKSYGQSFLTKSAFDVVKGNIFCTF